MATPQATPGSRRNYHVMIKGVGPICNLDCDYCYYLEKTALFPGGGSYRMSEETLEQFTQAYIRTQSGPYVMFPWHGGEPTILGIDYYRKAIELQQKYLPKGWRCDNILQTNGTLLTPEWGKFFREANFLIGISIDGPAQYHDLWRKDRQRRGSHERVMRGLRVLQDHGVAHTVLCTVHRANAEAPLEVYGFFRDNGVTTMQFIPVVEPLPGGGVSERSVPARAYGTFLSTIFDEWLRHDVERVWVQIFEECLQVWKGKPANLCIFRETCGDALAVEHNGDLFCCDHYVKPSHRLGNVVEDGMAKLLRSPVLHAFGNAKRDTLPGQCRRCDVRFMCNGGCPKDRIISTADGEPGLNYLCEGYLHFFRHVRPVMEQIVAPASAPAAVANAMTPATAQAAPAQPASAHAGPQGGSRGAPGRNDPCPCGSGRKYKACCLPRDSRRATV
ncbi:MAG: anaerobic sulfatase maturase [Candidatus Lambdaproteobacteria bacterium]|nr:anaerobic sulfatase maturase [Candidatus Lambdaproteobacteria bacterium]